MADDSWRHSLPGPSGASSSSRRRTGSSSDDEPEGNARGIGGDDGGDGDYGGNDDDDDDDSDDEPLFGRSGFPHLDDTDLTIVQRQLDDMYVGVASKTRFARAEGQNHLRFIFDSEFDLYLRRYVLPRLRDVFSGRQSYWVWLSVNMRFQQISDPTDFFDFWSAYRQESWYLSWMHSATQREQFIRHIISEWSDDVYSDVANMCSQESGWSFYSITCVDVRVAANTPTNRLRFAGHPVLRPFHPLLKDLFRRIVIDPARKLKAGYNRNTLCVPACVLLAIHVKIGPAMKSVSKTAFESELKLLGFSSLLDISKPGIALSQLSAFEELLSPIPASLRRKFPLLSVYRGISLNVFTVQRKDDAFDIFPTSLSKHSRNSQFFQVDMMVDNDDIREARNTTSPIRNVLHCLLITRLPGLITRFSKGRNSYRWNNMCRVCMTTFYNTEAMNEHFKICIDRKRGVSGKRRATNRLLHQPYRLNKFNGRKEVNGMFFQRGKCARLLKPLSLSCLDFENFSRTITEESAANSVFENIPGSASTIQTPLSYSIQHRSLYPDIPLPESLDSPRIKFIDESDPAPEQSFFLSLLYTIREDLLLHSRFIRDLLANDRPPPPMNRRTAEQIAYIMSVARCQICAVLFGSRKVSPKTKESYVVKRCFDHFHFLQDSSRIRAVTCQVTFHPVFSSIVDGCRSNDHFSVCFFYRDATFRTLPSDSTRT